MVYRCTTSYSKSSTVLFNSVQASLRHLPRKTLDCVQERLLEVLGDYYAPYGLVASLEIEEPPISGANLSDGHALTLSDYLSKKTLLQSSEVFEKASDPYEDPFFKGDFCNLSSAKDSAVDFDPISYLNWPFNDPNSAYAYTIKFKLFRNQTLTQAIKEEHDESVITETALSPTPQDVAQFASILLDNNNSPEPVSATTPHGPYVGTISVSCTGSLLGDFFDLNHVDLSNHALVNLSQENQAGQNDTELLKLCYDCADAEEELSEALAALPKEQTTKKRIALRILQAVMDTGRTYSKCYLPGLIKVLKQTTALVKDNIDIKFSAYKDCTVKKVTEVKNKSHQLIKQYLGLAKELNEQAQPRKLVGALMMLAGVALLAIGIGFGLFTGGLSLLILVTGVPFALISGGATMYQHADTKMCHEMKNLARHQVSTLKKNTQPASVAPVLKPCSEGRHVAEKEKKREAGGFKRRS